MIKLYRYHQIHIIPSSQTKKHLHNRKKNNSKRTKIIKHLQHEFHHLQCSFTYRFFCFTKIIWILYKNIKYFSLILLKQIITPVPNKKSLFLYHHLFSNKTYKTLYGYHFKVKILITIEFK